MSALATDPEPTIRYRMVHSRHPAALFAKRAYRSVTRFSLPAPRVLVLPVLRAVLGVRSVAHFVRRVFYAEPLFKAYCAEYGRDVHTGIFLHWVIGKGRIILGDDVLVDGKSSFIFAARYSANPTLRIGNRSGLGHNCVITVAKSITIGDDCRIAGGVTMFDSSGHPSDPDGRRRGEAAPDDAVRPIVIEDNVWLGGGVTIYPGVTIGANSVVATGAVVTASCPPNSLLIGNPARRMMSV